MKFFQGLLGNLSEMTEEAINSEFGVYFMEGEEALAGFRLIRDVVIITDRRIITFDKQGTTGQKMEINSIYLDSIIEVSVETAGFGIDDSELTVKYISSPYYRASGGVELGEITYEFPKKFNVSQLYRRLSLIAYENHLRINR